MKLAWTKAILTLPFNATITIPLLILYFTDSLSLSQSPLFVFSALVLFFAGLSLAVWTMLLFANVGKGTLAPWNPTKKLVIVGPYAHVRNPMLSGVITMIFGEALLFSSFGVFVWGLLFFCINTVYFIYSEEPGLERRFGKDYLQYKRNVPRWIPRADRWKP